MADGEASTKEAIKAGISLNAAGLEMLNRIASDEETEKFIAEEKGGYVWDHPNTAAEGPRVRHTLEGEP